MRYLAPIRVLTCGHFFVVVRAGVHVLTGEDLKDWDWLPGAAGEIADYLRRLLTEGAIDAHDVSARHKSIQSFQDKCARKAYDDPRRQVTDCVAARIITYSITDRNKVCELIRSRFELSEDRMPGEEKEERRRGYDCVHLIATGERSGASTGWLVGGGDLATTSSASRDSRSRSGRLPHTPGPSSSTTCATRGSSMRRSANATR